VESGLVTSIFLFLFLTQAFSELILTELNTSVVNKHTDNSNHGNTSMLALDSTAALERLRLSLKPSKRIKHSKGFSNTNLKFINIESRRLWGRHRGHEGRGRGGEGSEKGELHFLLRQSGGFDKHTDIATKAWLHVTWTIYCELKTCHKQNMKPGEEAGYT